MQYPKFLKKDDLIGITALSCGIGSDLLETKCAFNHLKKEFKLIVTSNVYGDYIVSSDKETRVKEFNELLDEDIKMILIYRGGDFLYETLDKLDYKKLVKKNIWVMGYSDPSSLLYLLTTKYDIATIYGLNAHTFGNEKLEPYQLNSLEIIQGDLLKQESFMDRKTVSLNGDFEDRGVMIGGCLDVIRYLIGTSYDNTLKFIEKYRDKEIIWYFDIFCMDSVDLYLTLLQMQNMGYFKYSKTFLFGSVCYPKEECELTYIEAIKKVFMEKNIVYDANIGHVKPAFTIINGSLGCIKYSKNKLSLEMKLMS